MKSRRISGWLCLLFSVLAVLVVLAYFKKEATDTNLEKVTYEKNEEASLEAFQKKNPGEEPGGRLEAEMLGTSSLGEPKTNFSKEELTKLLREGTSDQIVVPQRREGILSSIFLPQNYCEKTIICEEFKKNDDYCIDTESGDCLQIQLLIKGSMEEFFKSFHKKLLTQTKKLSQKATSLS